MLPASVLQINALKQSSLLQPISLTAYTPYHAPLVISQKQLYLLYVK